MFAVVFFGLESARFRSVSYMVGLRVIERVSHVDAEVEVGAGLVSAAVVERVATVRGHSGHHGICYRVKCDFVHYAKRRVSFAVR